MATYSVGDLSRREILKISAALAGSGVVLSSGLAAPAAAAPEGTMTWGVHITLASRWLDPAETEGIITPFMVLYALHDALVKPMPAGINTPCLAESWTGSEDGLAYEFVLRKGITFHNGEPVTAEDVKFSFDRYRGSGAKLLKDRVREVQIVDAGDSPFIPGEQRLGEVAYRVERDRLPSLFAALEQRWPDAKPNRLDGLRLDWPEVVD